MRGKTVQVLVFAAVVAGCGLASGGPPAPVGAQLCIGVPEATCREILQGRINNRAPVQLVGFRITCKTTCNAASGDAEVALTWADGLTEISSYSWVGGP